MANRLFKQIDIASLAFFRIVFGILAMAESMALFFYYHLHEHSYEFGGFQFKYYGFEWVQPFPEPLMSLFFIVLILAAIFIALGKWYRQATIVFAVFFIYSFLLEKTHYLNHGYLLCWLAVTMIFLPANRAFSLDVRKDPSIRRTTIPAWTLWILCFFMGVVYFFGGIAKINADWLNAMPLKLWLKYKSDIPLVGPIIAQEWVAWLMAYAGLLLDLFVVFLLLNRKTRLVAFLFAVAFHLINVVIFNIGIFPWLSIMLTSLFFPPRYPRDMLSWMGKKFKFIPKWMAKWQNHVAASPPDKQAVWQEIPANRPKIKFVLFALILFHFTYPLRHHLLPGPVSWTEEGHRYSWRMMLRTKQGRAKFTVADKKTGETFVINPFDSLTQAQARDVASHPDMVLMYAHYLRDMYEERLGNEVSVHAKVRVRLNGRKYQDFIDPEVDLAKEKWKWLEHSEWIMEYPALEEGE